MRRFFWPLALLALLPSLGCEPVIPQSGKDIAYLTERKPPEGKPAERLLLLTVGNRWEFQEDEVREGQPPHREEAIVTGTTQIGPHVGVIVSLKRDGRVWRQEIYRNSDKEIQLLAFGDASANRIELSSPMALMRYPLTEGATTSWEGTLLVKGKRIAARGYSRVSTRETLVTPAGRFISYRIDTVLSLDSGGQKTHFPTIRWLAPGIGFVKRGYAVDGKPTLSSLVKFSVR